MTIVNYIIQSKSLTKSQALQNLQKQAIFLTQSYHAIQSMTPYKNEKAPSLEYVMTMKVELTKCWRDWHTNLCQMEVILVPEELMNQVYKSIKSFYVDTKTEAYCLGMYWLVKKQKYTEKPRTISLWLDIDDNSEFQKYLKSLQIETQLN